MDKLNKKISHKLSLRKYPLLRECFAEFLGTFMLITFGDGSVAQFLLSKGAAGDQNTIAWSFGVGITTGVLVAGGVSGGHINPAVSLAMSCLGRLPFWKFPCYALSQYCGGFLASVFLYLVYTDALDNYDGGDRAVEGLMATGGIWATYPQPYVSTANGLGDQIFATALLMISVLAVTDKFNTQPSSGLGPFLVGYVVVGIAMAFGLNAAFAINPARDLGPRLFTLCGGWGTEPFTFRDYNWFWVPIVGPHIGALAGALLYELCVGIHWPDRYEGNRAEMYAFDMDDKSSKGGKSGNNNVAALSMESVKDPGDVNIRL